MEATCSSIIMGEYWGCFISSTMRDPRLSWAMEVLSSSAPNWAKAASSLYWAMSSLSFPATFLVALVWALPPTRETEIPTLMAGRIPELKRFDSKKIWPSVMEMTLVGM